MGVILLTNLTLQNYYFQPLKCAGSCFLCTCTKFDIYIFILMLLSGDLHLQFSN